MTNLFHVFLVAVTFTGYAKVKSIGDHGYFIESIEHHNYVAAIFLNGTYECGATIISERKIVTAAHCVTGGRKKNRVTVSFGTIDRISYNNTRLVEAKDIDLHPNYSFDNLYLHDVAILWIEEPIHFGIKIGKIEMVPCNYIPQSGQEVTVFGFAKIEQQRNGHYRTIYDSLKGVNATVMDFVECEHIYSEALEGPNHLNKNQEFCLNIHEQRNNIDDGDSGGPLVTRDGLFLGIVSGMFPNKTDIFINVGGYRDFLDKPDPETCTNGRGKSKRRRQ